ncbi:MFS transporter [Streptomyces sp. NBC_01433]|uniref:MFS transporter n=1 Tax=Streptomyces sp. NBC_01433 TaxID=2903864 RepID=UPI0022598C2B|nr:MFS transporter [Streptomyces sp. NBC_01433]MCX4681342.1 MFS transporter [Streptomyces sp. NBC_01433]MCX4681720.1 MFS transporter [Streptomyces sp. NBC_01433]MCX4682418.1 MFS transporter [Streptomyces sp. NBC_01433]
MTHTPLTEGTRPAGQTQDPRHDEPPVSESLAATTAPPAGAVKRWPMEVWLLLGGTLVVRGAGFAYPFLSYRLSSLGFSASLVAWVLAAFGGGWLTGQVLFGWLADRLGRRTTLVCTMLAAAVILPVLGEVRSPLALLTTSFLAGVVYDASRPIVSALIADLVPSEGGRAVVNGWRHFAVNVGAALTGSLGGLLAGQAGLPLLFWINAVACAVFGIAAWRFLRPGHTPGTVERGGYRQALKDGRLWLVSLASWCALTCASGMFTALPMLMTAHHLDATAYGWTQAANAAAVLFLSPLVTPWLGRRASSGRPMTGVVAASSLFLGAGMGAAGLATSTLGFSLCVAAAVPGEILLFVGATDIVNRIAPPHARGRYAGLWGTTLALSVITAPVLTAWALNTGGDVLVAVTTFLAGALGAALCLPLHAALRSHAPDAPAPLSHPVS